MAKTRVLHLITRLPIGGAERLLLGVLANLNSDEFDSVVCCIQDRGELAAEVESLGIPVINLGLMQRSGFDFHVVPALRRVIRTLHVDIVHAHLYHANLYGRLAARREGVVAIASVHNTYTKRKWHRHLINRWLASQTYVVTAGSEEVERDLLNVDHIPPDKVIRLPNSIDFQRVETGLDSAQAKTLVGLEKEDLVIGTVGRAVEQKGHTFLLDAFFRLRQVAEYKRLKLLIVGDGLLLPKLKKQSESLGIAESCRFLGNVTDLANIYRSIDIFVMPSLWEGLSLAMLEAMASGLPVVATDVGGVREVLKDNIHGLLVPTRDSIALADALNMLIANPASAHAIATLGRAHVRANYGVESLTGKLSRIYRRAICPSV